MQENEKSHVCEPNQHNTDANYDQGLKKSVSPTYQQPNHLHLPWRGHCLRQEAWSFFCGYLWLSTINGEGIDGKQMESKYMNKKESYPQKSHCEHTIDTIQTLTNISNSSECVIQSCQLHLLQQWTTSFPVAIFTPTVWVNVISTSGCQGNRTAQVAPKDHQTSLALGVLLNDLSQNSFDKVWVSNLI